MLRPVLVLLLFLSALLPVFFSSASVGFPRQSPSTNRSIELRRIRSSPFDLELAGDLRDLPAGSVRYLRREELLAMPQASFTAASDANFGDLPTPVSGVMLDELVRRFAAQPRSDMVIAISSDLYNGNFPREYLAAHHPLLVLKIDGKSPDAWPKAPVNPTLSLGPFLISHEKFTPSFKVLSHSDEPQIPWGVVRIEFRDQQSVLGAIAPRGAAANNPAVQAGYRIAEQNCFRCHNLDDNGGKKSGRSWFVLAAYATASSEHFTDYVRDPKSSNPKTQMPGNPGYDTATLDALTNYFRSFLPQDKAKR
jgi:mono/diheme cytochrome c family protein